MQLHQFCILLIFHAISSELRIATKYEWTLKEITKSLIIMLNIIQKSSTKHEHAPNDLWQRGGSHFDGARAAGHGDELQAIWTKTD